MTTAVHGVLNHDSSFPKMHATARRRLKALPRSEEIFKVGVHFNLRPVIVVNPLMDYTNGQRFRQHRRSTSPP